MENFKEWLKKEDEKLEEGWMKNLAVGGALLGAGMGLGRMQNNAQPEQGQQPQAQVQQVQKSGSWLQYKKAEMARQKAELQRKTQGMKSGQSRTFVHGQEVSTTGPDSDKDIESSSVTSPDAASYFR